MVKIALKVDHRKVPLIREVLLIFHNGKRIKIEAGDKRLDKADFMQWLGPEEPQLIFDLRLILSAEDLNIELKAIDGR